MVKINEENLEKFLSEKKIAVLQFSAEWCSPCKVLTPIMVELSMDNLEKDVKFGKIDIESSSDLGVKYQIRSIPTIIFLSDGVELGRVTGLKGKHEYQFMIDELLK